MPKRILQGTVVSISGDKTISVKVERKISHGVYKKIVSVSKKYAVHDENNKASLGDLVKIIESKPISKRKRWVLLDEAA